MADTLTLKHAVWIAAPVEQVFELVGTAQGWNRWFTTECVLEPRPGGRFIPEWRDFGPDRHTARDEGRVINLQSPRHIAFEWTPLPGVRTRFSLDLTPEGNGTTVRVSDHGYPTGTHAEIRDAGNSAAGWGEALTLLKFCAEHGLRYRQPHDPAPAPAAEPATGAPVSPAKRKRGKREAA